MMRKNGKVKLAIIIGVLLVLLGVAAGLIWKFSRPATEEPKKEEEEVNAETYLLFSFESYEDITGTKIRFMNSFGATSVNTDEKYITEGEASWLIKPEGSYATPNNFPTVQFNCVGSTIKTNNFAEFDTVLMDVYNDSEEEVTIRWSFTMNNALGGTAEAQQEFVLAPKAWTTCTFDLTGEEFTYLYLKDYVAYMNLTVLRVKENREDTVPTLYVDNVRGHYTDAPYTSSALDFNLREGITFEKSSDRYIFRETSKDDPETYTPLTRVAYADTNVEPLDETLGSYALKGVATGRPYPGFTVNFDKMYGDGNTLRFMMYVEVDPAKAEGVIFKSEAWGSVPYPGYPGDYKANEWVEVHIPMTEFGESLYIFTNLSATIEGKVHSKFGDDTEVNIYFDNFIIEDTRSMSYKQEDGSYVLSNPYGMNWVTLDLKGEDYGGFKKGDYLAFDYEFKTKKPITMWVLGNGQWGPGYEVIPALDGYDKPTVKVQFLQDWDYVQIYVRFNEGPFTECGATVSNIRVFRESNRGFSKYDFTQGISFETQGEKDILLDTTIATYNNKETYMPLKRVEYANTDVQAPDESCGDYVMAGDATGRNYPAFTALFDKVYSEGKTLQFKMYVQVDENKAEGKIFKVEGKDGAGGGTFFTGYPDKMKANEWIDVSMPITTDISELYFFLNLHDNGNEAENYRLFGQTPVTVYFDNFQIVDTVKDVEKTPDGSIILYNPYGAQEVAATLLGEDYGGFKAGSTLNFNISTNKAATVSVYVLGNGEWGQSTQIESFKTINGTIPTSVTFTEDWDFIVIDIIYEGQVDYSQYVTTLSNIGTKDIVDANGDIEIANPSGEMEVQATLLGKNYGGFKAGSTLNFDISINESATVSVYVLGNGEWGQSTQIEAFKPVNGTINTGITFTEDYDYVVINILYEGQVDYSKYVATLSNISVKEAAAADGEIVISNPDGFYEVQATLLGSNYGGFKAGSTLNFDISMNESATVSVYVLGNGEWGQSTQIEAFKPINGTINTGITFTEDYDYVVINILYEGQVEYSKYVATLSNISVKESAGGNGEIVISNPDGLFEVQATLLGNNYGGFKAGSTLNFDISMNERATVSVYVLGNGEWGRSTQIEAFKPINGTISTGIIFTEDYDYVVINILYEGQVEYSKYVATLSNISVKEAAPADGEIVISNPEASIEVQATLLGNNYGGFKAGDKLSFDISMNESAVVSVYVLGNGSWGQSTRIEEFTPIDDTISTEFTFTEAYEYVVINILYEGQVDYQKYVATLKNIKVE